MRVTTSMKQLLKYKTTLYVALHYFDGNELDDPSYSRAPVLFDEWLCDNGYEFVNGKPISFQLSPKNKMLQIRFASLWANDHRIRYSKLRNDAYVLPNPLLNPMFFPRIKIGHLRVT